MKYAFLFGSGLSIPAGMPSTRDLSNMIRVGDGVHRQTSGSYLIDKAKSPSGRESEDQAVRGMFATLSLLQAEADLYYHSGRPSNYEDWFYVAQQVEAALTRDFDNPVAGSLTRELKQKLHDVLEGTYNDRGSRGALMDDSGEVCSYIRTMVADQLRHPGQDLRYLRWVLDAVHESKGDLDAIFTLNHDCLLEELLTGEKLGWFDGFAGEREGQNGLFWTPREFSDSQANTAVRLVKLHGSVGWLEGIIEETNARGTVMRDEHVAFRLRERETPKPGIDKIRPLLLIGRHNKTYDYLNFVFEDLHYRFYRGLQAIDRLVVCGYSFGDKAINTRIINWMNGRTDKKLIIIHDKDPFYWADLRVAARRNMEAWQEDKRFCWIPARAETVTWQQIKDALDG